MMKYKKSLHKELATHDTVQVKHAYVKVDNKRGILLHNCVGVVDAIDTLTGEVIDSTDESILGVYDFRNPVVKWNCW